MTIQEPLQITLSMIHLAMLRAKQGRQWISCLGFTGRERDEESDLNYHRARYYSPTIGRWLSEDPIGFSAGDTNLRRYVNNSPVNYVDPSGNSAMTALGPGSEKLWEDDRQEKSKLKPSDFTLDFTDTSLDSRIPYRENVRKWYPKMTQHDVEASYSWGCGDLFARRCGLMDDQGDFNLPNWGKKNVHMFPTFEDCTAVADILVQQGRVVRLFIFQQKEEGGHREPTYDDLPYRDHNELPSEFKTGESFNYVALDWDGTRFTGEYIADGHSDVFVHISLGNLPPTYPHNYFGLVILTQEDIDRNRGLPNVPWDETTKKPSRLGFAHTQFQRVLMST